MTRFSKLIVALVALLLMTGAQAALIPYQVSFNWDDGGSATGTFNFETVTDTYSSVNISTTAGTTIPSGHSYSDAGIVASSTDTVLFVSNDGTILSQAGDYGINLFFASSLDGGGTISLNFTTLEADHPILCCTRNIQGAGFVTQVVPLPAAVWLFGSALGLLGWMRRKSA